MTTRPTLEQRRPVARRPRPGRYGRVERQGLRRGRLHRRHQRDQRPAHLRHCHQHLDQRREHAHRPGVEAAAGAVVDGKFYVMGGDDFNNGLNTTYIYDIATNTWTTGATLPDNRTNTYGTAYNGMIYVYGGVILRGSRRTDTLLRYDPVANSWTNLGSAGTAGLGNYGGISPFGTGQLLIADGADSTGASTTGTHIFNIGSGTFSLARR